MNWCITVLQTVALPLGYGTIVFWRCSIYHSAIWSGLRGSNSLPPPWQGGALPDELKPHFSRRLLKRRDLFYLIFFVLSTLFSNYFSAFFSSDERSSFRSILYVLSQNWQDTSAVDCSCAIFSNSALPMEIKARSTRSRVQSQ